MVAETPTKTRPCQSPLALALAPRARALSHRIPRSPLSPSQQNSGVNIKTRKRNIQVALDPGSFADAVVTIFEVREERERAEREKR